MTKNVKMALLLALSVGVFGKLAVAQSAAGNVQAPQVQYAVFHPDRPTLSHNWSQKTTAVGATETMTAMTVVAVGSGSIGVIVTPVRRPATTATTVITETTATTTATTETTGITATMADYGNTANNGYYGNNGGYYGNTANNNGNWRNRNGQNGWYDRNGNFHP